MILEITHRIKKEEMPSEFWPFSLYTWTNRELRAMWCDSIERVQVSQKLLFCDGNNMGQNWDQGGR